MAVEEDRREWRTWRLVISIGAALVIMVVAAIDLAQPAWLLIGFIGPAALAGDEVARLHRRRTLRRLALRAAGPPPDPPVTL